MQCSSACTQCGGICCENALKPGKMNDFNEKEWLFYLKKV